jgi:hypothetical protein
MWKAWLSLAEFWYNTSYHSVLGYPPFKVLYGYNPPFTVCWGPSASEGPQKHDLTMFLEYNV